MSKSYLDLKHKVVGIIPARYASSRFPGKMLASIAGQSLIQRTYKNAQLCDTLDDLVIATDTQQLYDHIRGFGGEVVMTSPSCINGSERLAEAVRSYTRFDDATIIVNIQGDEPCIDPNTINSIVDILKGDPTAVMSTAVTRLTSQEEGSSSAIVKCVFDQNQNALYFSRALIPAEKSLQWNPRLTYYRHLGIYAYRRDFLLQYNQLPSTPLQGAEDLEQLRVLEHGFKIKAAIVANGSIGVDLPEDIQRVEQWLCKRNTSL